MCLHSASLSVLVLHYWSNARIFHIGYIEPFQQPNRCYCILMCARWWLLPPSTPLLKRTSCKDCRHLPVMRRWSICFLSLWLGEIQVSLCISLCANRMTKLLIPQNSISRVRYNVSTACDSSIWHNVSTAWESRVRHNVSMARDSRVRHNVSMTCDSRVLYNVSTSCDSRVQHNVNSPCNSRVWHNVIIPCDRRVWHMTFEYDTV